MNALLSRANQRTACVVGSVLLFHGLAIWALQTGLLQRVGDWVVPVVLLSEPPPTEPPKPLPPPVTAKIPPAKAVPSPEVAPAPTPLALPPDVLAGATPAAPSVAATAALSVPVAPAAAPAAAVAAPKVDLPTTVADYQSKSPPVFPAMSKRLGEQGRVVVRVLIGADGAPQQAEVSSSSGFARLDKAALEAVLRWRYVPGKRGGVAEAMWFLVPIQFKLDNE